MKTLNDCLDHAVQLHGLMQAISNLIGESHEDLANAQVALIHIGEDLAKDLADALDRLDRTASEA